VTFDIDANGILNVTAHDKATGKEQKVTITASTNLEKSEIDNMVRTAREHEAEDRRRRELVEARNNADTLAYQTEKTLRDLGDKIPAGERQNIENKVKDLREAIKGEDTSRIRQLTEEVQNAFHAISQQMYAQGQGQPGNGRGPQSPEDEGEVVEGEFREA
jgi:molecular chaperone DnaK